MALPNPGMSIDSEHTALVVTDPQNDFLSPEGVTWGVVGESVTENKTVENIEGERNSGVYLASLLLPLGPRLAVRGSSGSIDAQHRHVRSQRSPELRGF